MDNTLFLSCGVKTSADPCQSSCPRFLTPPSPPPLPVPHWMSGASSLRALKSNNEHSRHSLLPCQWHLFQKSRIETHNRDWFLMGPEHYNKPGSCFPVKRNRKTVHIEELWLHFLVPPSIPRVVHCVSSSPTETVPEATEHLSLRLWLGGQQSLSQCWLHFTSDLLREGRTPPTRRKGPGLNELYNVSLLRADAPQQVQWL